MAFTVLDNSPVIGAIAWSDLHIMYQGTSYAIDDGFTTAVYAYWEPTISLTSLQAANSLPTLSADGLVVFLNKEGIHVTVPGSSVVEGSLIVEESILANAIAANQINGTHIIGGTILAEHLGAIDVEVGKHIESSSYTPGVDGWHIGGDGSAEFNDVTVRGDVTTNRLVAVPGTENFVGPGTFPVDIEGWTSANAIGTLSRVATPNHGGAGSLRIARSGSGTFVVRSPAWPVEADQAFQARVWIDESGSNGGVVTRIRWEDASGNLLPDPADWYSYLPENPVWPGFNQWYMNGEGETFVAPAGAEQARLEVLEALSSSATSSIYIDDVAVVAAPILMGGYRSSDSDSPVEILTDNTVTFRKASTYTIAAQPQLGAYLFNKGTSAEQFSAGLTSGSFSGRNPATLGITSESQDGTFPTTADVIAERVVVGGYPTSDVRVRTIFCDVRRSATQNIPQNTNTTILFDTGVKNDWGIYSAGTGRITVPEAGLYFVATNLRFLGTGGTYRRALVRRNGTEAVAVDPRPVQAGGTTFVPLATMVYLDAGDYITIEGLHDSTNTVSVSNADQCSFRVARIGV